MKFTLYKLTDLLESDDEKVTAAICNGRCAAFEPLPGAVIHFQLNGKKELVHTEYTDSGYDDAEFEIDASPIEAILKTHEGMEIYAKADHKNRSWIVTDIVRLHGKHLRVFDYESLRDFCQSYNLIFPVPKRDISAPTIADFKSLCHDGNSDRGVILKNYDYMCLQECVCWVSLTCEGKDKK